MHPRLHAALAFVATLTLTPAGAAQAPSRDGERLTRDQALATFDSAWRRIADTHYDIAMRGVDWGAVRDSVRPRAESARTLGAVRQAIRTMLDALGESHFALIPQEVADGVRTGAIERQLDDEPGDVGLEFRLLGDTVVVSRVRPGSPAAVAGVRPGWILDTVGAFGARATQRLVAAGGVPRFELKALVPARAGAQFAGVAGTSVDATFRSSTGRIVRRRLIREPVQGTPVRFGNLPTMVVTVEHEARALPARSGCVGIIRFTAWMLPVKAQLDSAVDGVRHCRGVVLDIRGNPGGVGAMVMGFGGHFLDTAATLGHMQTRSNRLRFITNPQRVGARAQPVTPFAGPVAILVDSLSMSTSEIFAAGMKAIGRARIFGENTPGLALPALATRLPSGDVLMHVVADYTDAAGQRVEGRGVAPHVLTPLTRRDLLAGRDRPLEEALTWITDAVGPEA